MSVFDLCRTVQHQWQALRRAVWPEKSQPLTQNLTDQLLHELKCRYRGLIARRRRIEKLRDRLRNLERQLDINPTSLPLREAIQHNRERMARREAGYAERHGLFLKRKQLHKALVRGQVIVCADPTDPELT